MKFVKIEFSSGSYRENKDKFVLNLKNKIMFVSNDFFKTLKPGKASSIKLSDEEVAALDKKLQNLHFEKWQSEYSSDEIFDGTQWNVTVYCDDGIELKFYGSNDYPDEYDELKSIFEPLNDVWKK